MRLEQMVALQPQKASRQLSLLTHNAFDCDAGIVVADSPRHASKKGEGLYVSVPKTFGTF